MTVPGGGSPQLPLVQDFAGWKLNLDLELRNGGGGGGGSINDMLMTASEQQSIKKFSDSSF